MKVVQIMKNEQEKEIEYAPYQWIGVMVALPPINEDVVVTNALIDGKPLWVTWRSDDKNEQKDSNGFVLVNEECPEVTHWMRIERVNLSTAHDIDWSKSIAEIDKQLYKKYGLSQQDIDFIERTIKPME